MTTYGKGGNLLRTDKDGESYWLLNKSKYPGVTDLHLHVAGGTFNIAMTYKGRKSHWQKVDAGITMTEFGNHLDYMYRKVVQAFGPP